MSRQKRKRVRILSNNNPLKNVTVSQSVVMPQRIAPRRGPSDSEEIHYRIHKRSPPVRILRQTKPVHVSHYICLRFILILQSYLHLGLPSVLFPSGIFTKILYVPIHKPIRTTRLTNLIILDFITRLFGKKYSTSSSSLCSLLHSPCYLVSTRPKHFTQHPQPMFPVQCEKDQASP
jgi:hypothetical protein